VDDAIVMIENVVRYIERGVPPLQAAYRGAGQIGFTIVSLTVSLIAVFIPLLLMSGVVGRLFKEFSVTLAVSVVVSAVISLTLTPMMCGRLLRAGHGEPGLISRCTEAAFSAVLAGYRRTLDWSFRHQPMMLTVGALTLAGTIGLYIVAPKGFLPNQDTGVVLAVTEAAQSASIGKLAGLQARAAEVIRRDPAVTGVVSFVGAGTINTTPNTGRLTIALKPIGQRDPMQAVLARLRTAIAGIPGLTAWFQPVQDVQISTRVSRTRYQYTLMDTDAAELAAWAPRLQHALAQRAELTNVTSDQANEGFRTYIDVDRDAAMRLGVSMQAIADTLCDGFGQRQISTIFSQANQYRVILEAEPAWQADPDSLRLLRVPAMNGAQGNGQGNGQGNASGNVQGSAPGNASGNAPAGAQVQGSAQVPLSAIARIERVTAPLVITHQAQFPAVTISFDVAPGYALAQAVDAIAQTSAAIGMPATITTNSAGDAAEFQRSLAAEPWLIIAAVVVIYIVLGVLYESWIHPVTILSTLPSAGIGAVLALMLCGIDLSLVALVGIVLLMGIVKKNAIMMVDFALEAERTRGLAPAEAMREACLLRFRPIMMTTMAALLGAVPLVIERGAGSELRYPLGVTIIGGLLLSQFLTLYTTPAIYLGFEHLRSRLGGAASAAAAE
jgi:multidrug efflux pump